MGIQLDLWMAMDRNDAGAFAAFGSDSAPTSAVHHGVPYLSFLEALFERGGRVDVANHAGDRPLDMYRDGYPKSQRLYERFLKSL